MTAGKKRIPSIDRSVIYGLIAAIAATVCLITGFTYKPQLYPIDFGQYELIMRDTGLAWTADDIAKGDLQYSRPLLQFDYTDISWFRLFTPRAGNSIVYPIALFRMFTEPFGINLSVNAMAYILVFILVICVFFQMGYLIKLFGKHALLPIIGLCLLFTDSNFCAIFRGLYPQGIMIVYTVLFITALSGYFASKGERRLPHMVAIALSSVLLLHTCSQIIVFLPAFILLGVYLIFHERELLSRHMLGAGITIVIATAFILRAVPAVMTDPDLVSDAAVYNSFFGTMLPNSDNPSVLLKEFDLDESYLSDIGHSYYDPENSFAHNPRNEAVAQVLFEKLTPSKILFTYLRHPDDLARAVAGYPYRADSYENVRNSGLSRNAKNFVEFRNPAGIVGLLRNFFRPSYMIFHFITFFLLILAFVMWIRKKGLFWLCFSVFSLCACLYIPFVTIFSGYSEGSQPILYQVFLQDLLEMAMILIVFNLGTEFRVWMMLNSKTPVPAAASRGTEFYPDNEAADQPGKFQVLLRKVLSAVFGLFNSAALTVIFFTVLSVAMLLMVFLPAEHPATVNNGDYGRMMTQVDLSWITINYFDTNSQVLHKAIEEYVYLKPFDPVKLTPLKPTYTLYWFVSMVRLCTEPFGLPFTTRNLAIVMGLTMILCTGVIVHDIHKYCGKWTFVVGFLLCSLLMSETYLTWFNSMFGEGTIIAGLMLTLMCTVHLIVIKPKYTSFLWLFGLIISLYILCGAKSQMLLAAPGACLLFLFVTWYARPFRYDLQALWFPAALCLTAALVVGAIGVYQSDRDESSVSQRHTMWQAYFYGIFMISDDPIGDMEEMGIDTAMAPDIGKFVQFDDDSMYVYAPLSEEAGPAFYDHVSMVTIVIWYLKHPTKLWYMLDHAASESKELYTGFRVYIDEDYSDLDHREVNGFDLWPGWRGSFTPSTFLGYVILYVLIIIASIQVIRDRSLPIQMRSLPSIVFFLMITGGLQFPLSVLGNGFADNHKQLFAFSLCHDLLLCMTICYVIYKLKTFKRCDHEESNGSIRDQAGSDQDVPAGAGAEEEQETGDSSMCDRPAQGDAEAGTGYLPGGAGSRPGGDEAGTGSV